MEQSDQAKLRELVRSIDFAQTRDIDESLNLLAQLLLFGTKWQAVFGVKAETKKKIPIIEDVPLICKGSACEYAARCPILRGLTKDEDKLRLVGTECRADRIYALEEFASLVKELDITPDQTTDIINVASLVRLLLLKRRVDWTLATEGIQLKEPKVIDQKSGQVYFSPVAHPLFKVSESLEKQVAALQKQLMADRQARATLAATLGTKGNNLLKELFAGNLALGQHAIEAEFTDNPEEE